MSSLKKNASKSVALKYKVPSKYFLILYLLVIIFTFLKVYDGVFDKKINLGGDNASYYILGMSIAQGQGYANIHQKEKISHNHFPPGYPLIIAATSKLISNKIIVIKRMNGFFLLASLVLLFFIIFKITKNYHIAFISSYFVLFNFNLLSYSTIMMSEVPFLLFSLIGILLALSIDYQGKIYKNWKFLLLIVMVGFSYHIRSTGLALAIAISFWLFLEKRWTYLMGFVGGFVMLILPWFIRNRMLGGNAYAKQLMLKNPYSPEDGAMEIVDWFNRIWVNFIRYLSREIPYGTFSLVGKAEPQTEIIGSEIIIGSIFLVIILFGVFQLKSKGRLLIFYALAYMGILMLWPDVWYGIRFILPLIPILTFFGIIALYKSFIYIGVKLLNIKSHTPLLIVFMAVSLILIKFYADVVVDKLEHQSNSIFIKPYKNYLELAKWVNKNASDTSVTCCRKGQLFYLYSKKYVTPYKNTVNVEEQIEYLINKQVDYVVLDKLGYSSTSKYLYPAFIKYPNKFKRLVELKDPDTYLVEFRPELGYWGEWKDEKKHGQGDFKWESGSSYSGQWENDKRNGQGTFLWGDGKKHTGLWRDDKRNGKGVFYKEGYSYEGVWENDLLEGITDVKDIEGKLVEKRYYKNNKLIKIIEQY